jgi:hypothetical protein
VLNKSYSVISGTDGTAEAVVTAGVSHSSQQLTNKLAVKLQPLQLQRHDLWLAHLAASLGQLAPHHHHRLQSAAAVAAAEAERSARACKRREPIAMPTGLMAATQLTRTAKEPKAFTQLMEHLTADTLDSLHMAFVCLHDAGTNSEVHLQATDNQML